MEENTSVFSQTDYTKYHLSMKINPDGDFGWELVPLGFNYDFISEEFSYERDFPSLPVAQKQIEFITDFLLKYIYGRPFATKQFKRLLMSLRETVRDGGEFEEAYDGNFTWEVTFSQEYVPTAEELLAIDALKQCFSQGKVDASDILDMLNHCE